eukprot:g7037.t1
MAAEVVNLERSVLLTGAVSNAERTAFHEAQRGMHTGSFFGGILRVTYTRVEFCGQRGVLGRYCLHFHLLSHCPSCELLGNAVYESHQIGITVHGTHDSLVRANTLFNARGVGIYVEDGNEMNNTISENALTCDSIATCKTDRQTGIYLLGMQNDLLYNRVSGYQNTIFTPGSHAPNGNGVAWGKVCTVHTPYGIIRGNVGHNGGRFGIYPDNQYPRNVRLDADGYADLATCGEFKPDGSDNGAVPPHAIEDSLEFHQLFVGQYTMGDV